MAIRGLEPQKQLWNPPHFDLEHVIRPNILSLQPYRCARDDYDSGILLDANENSHGHSISPSVLSEQHFGVPDTNLHRYPSPSHVDVKVALAKLRGFGEDSFDHVFLGVGSDEIIDLLMRVCVKPGGGEHILITPPTYGMYAVTAHVNDVGILRCNLELEGRDGVGRFDLRVDEVHLSSLARCVRLMTHGWHSQMKKIIDANPTIKLIFLCSPGNPTGTLISLSFIRA
jgi:histidinol-phosphate aminotransferase